MADTFLQIPKLFHKILSIHPIDSIKTKYKINLNGKRSKHTYWTKYAAIPLHEEMIQRCSLSHSYLASSIIAFNTSLSEPYCFIEEKFFIHSWG